MRATGVAPKTGPVRYVAFERLRMRDRVVDVHGWMVVVSRMVLPDILPLSWMWLMMVWRAASSLTWVTYLVLLSSSSSSSVAVM